MRNKNFLLLLTVLLITAVFAGCASNKNTTSNISNTSETSTAQPNITNNSNPDVADNNTNFTNFSNISNITPNVDVDINEYLDKFRQITDDMTLEEIHQLVGEPDNVFDSANPTEMYYVDGNSVAGGSVSWSWFSWEYVVTINNYFGINPELPDSAGNLDKFRNIDKNYTKEQGRKILGEPDEERLDDPDSLYDHAYDQYNAGNGTVQVSYDNADGVRVIYIEELFSQKR
jgi:uncharacterized protein (UPF0333 family)